MRDIKSSPFTGMVNAGVDSYMKSAFFSIPGSVEDFDDESGLASVRIGVMKKEPNGFKEHDVLVNVKVAFSGCDFYFGHQIKPGCEGMVLFAQRDCDAWLNQGGVTEPVTARKFSMQDSFFTPNFQSIPNSIQNFKNDGAWIASKDCSSFIHLKDDSSAHIKVNGLVIDSDTTINGNLTVSETITGKVINALTSLMVAGINMLTHKHGGVSRGGDNTDGPQ